MLFKFSQYRFDTEQKLLTRQGHIVNLNDKPTELLILFLTEPDKIHSKAELLDNVWAGRVVTDQVVFQNINALRSLFGNDAIKTFPKKGYRWQLPVTVEAIKQSENVIEGLAESSFVEANRLQHETQAKLGVTGASKESKPIWLSISLLTISTLLVALFYTLIQPQSNPHLPLLYITTSNTDQDPIKHLLVNTLEEPQQHQALFDSPFKTWQLLSAENPGQKLIATKRYEIHSGNVLRFQIQGAKRGWHGYIFAETQDASAKKLNALLAEIVNTDFFEVQSDYEALARLVPLQKANPDSLLLMHQIIELNYSIGALDRAIALTENQIVNLTDSFNIARFHQLNAKVSTRNFNWQKGKQSNEVALRIFTELNLHPLMSDALIHAAWIKYFYQQNQGAMQSLNQAVKQARLANEPLLEVTAHLVQAFLASKMGQRPVMLNQIDLAQQLIELHQLHAEHLVAVKYHLAWGEEQSEQLNAYESMLGMPFSELYSHFLYGAAETVRDIYIAEGNIEYARKSIRLWQRPSFVALSQAHIAYAEGNSKLAVNNAIDSFNQAQIAQELEDALDAALLLIRYQQANVSVDNDSTYLDYIRQNASHRWLKQNSTALKQLGISGHYVNP